MNIMDINISKYIHMLFNQSHVVASWKPMFCGSNEATCASSRTEPPFAMPMFVAVWILHTFWFFSLDETA